jgi:hypothetical protein
MRLRDAQRGVVLTPSWDGVHDAVAGVAGTGAAGACTIAAEHLRRGPAVQLRQGPSVLPRSKLGVAEIVPGPVRKHIHAALLPATAGGHLVDAAGGHRSWLWTIDAALLTHDYLTVRGIALRGVVLVHGARGRELVAVRCLALDVACFQLEARE